MDIIIISIITLVYLSCAIYVCILKYRDFKNLQDYQKIYYYDPDSDNFIRSHIIRGADPECILYYNKTKNAHIRCTYWDFLTDRIILERYE